jgi:CDP-diacylglycerol--glycerol-3-phosphate 3-phosphatidyltransferase
MAAPAPARKVSNWSAPNIITIVRIFFAPAFIWLLLISEDSPSDPARWWAAGLFVVGMATDGVDGFIARRYNLITDLGKILDPIADKVLTGGALIGLSLIGELPWWVTILILAREVGITVFRFAVLSKRVIPASRGGKLKTVFQFLAITSALLPLQGLWGDWVNTLNVVLMSIAFALTIVTGIMYLVEAWLHNRASSESH